MPIVLASVILSTRFAIASPIDHLASILCFSTPKAIAPAVVFCSENMSATARIATTVPEVLENWGPIHTPIKLCPRMMRVMTIGRENAIVALVPLKYRERNPERSPAAS